MTAPASGPGATPPPARTPSFAEALRFWAKLGFISFGGPAGQIAILHREVVERRRWISEERFLHALSYCMLLPGPEAQQLATYVGWLLHRTPGGIAAGALFVLPSVFILLGLSWVYAAHGEVAAVGAVLAGFQPVVVAIVLEAVVRIGKRALRLPVHGAIAAISFVAIFLLGVSFPAIVLGAGLLGFLTVRFRPSLLAPARGGTAVATAPASAPGDVRSAPAIDDVASPPPHAIPSRARAVRVIAAFLVLWTVPYALLVLWRGASGLQASAYRFFTQAAFVTFGGAYAVLAYVTQVAVGSYGWITQDQAIAGLALAETTPGPLIMVLQFVGFMAGWTHPGGLSPATAGIATALATTYATFLPCFLFIFLGAPYIEQLRGNRDLAGALSFVTAAVVGVVLNLAVVFGFAVLFPTRLNGGVDSFAALVTIAAFAGLYLRHWNVVAVVAAGGATGLARMLLTH